MANIVANISISLDGFVAGRDQRAEQPLGAGGERLHEWMFRTAAWQRMHGRGGGEEGVDSDVLDFLAGGVDAYVMGRNMFGPGRGAWDETWKGWWGDEPPYHAPVFVLTHHPREPLVMEGGTTFHFVTEGFEAALAEASAVAGEQGRVSIAGGASAIRQGIACGRLKELLLHIVPILLGSGERLLEDVGDPQEIVPSRVWASPHVTHVLYDIDR